MTIDFILSKLSIRFQRRLKPSQIFKFPIFIFIFHRDDSQKAMAGCTKASKAREFKQTNTTEGLAHRKHGIELRNKKVVSRKMRKRDLRLAVMPTVRDQKHHAEIGSGR